MASGTKEKDILDLLKEYVPGPFKPYTYVSESGAITCYWRGEPDYSVAISSRLTFYKSMIDDSVIGFRLIP